ncbi:50S ribosomal protein L21 [Candidatus Oleimmundimicrobium sp.]|uniref:50S ribosomal protein L21 n=1 Tax=Candidatus Oleimmundimicrobium sp. TaxID=3060597 RepID=UPI0027282741|nr:50S ribosomal protein L21 [Candidatus Oleimmundimicrobium sp.]MDO8886146.1 50S ribosomal protein L21 [Candidatus Oleimmundimicrobium sp.]
MTWKDSCDIITSCVNIKGELALYALIKFGGKQYKVVAGEVVLLEKVDGNVGDSIELKDIIFVADEDKKMVESSDLSKANVKGTIVEQAKGNKVIIYKHKAKKGYRRKRGHRQLLTKVMIDEISIGEKKSKAPERAKIVTKKEVKVPTIKKAPTKAVKKVVAKPAKKTAVKSSTKKTTKKSSVSKKSSTSKSKTASKPKSK